MYSWIIIGGGIHGSFLAHLLRQTFQEEVAIIDPENRTIGAWRTYARRLGMKYMRSPGSHHLDIHPSSLLSYAEDNGWGKGHFVNPLFKPSLELFLSHCDHLAKTYEWNAFRITDKAESISQRADGSWSVTCVSGTELQSRRIILALGKNLQIPQLPDNCFHVFSGKYPEKNLDSQISIIGGGISAVQLAMHLADSGKSVQVYSKHPLKAVEYDNDPCFIGPRCGDSFLHEPSWDNRYTMIKKHTFPGSVPQRIISDFERYLSKSRITFHVSPEIHIKPDSIQTNKGTIRNQCIFATGFGNKVHPFLANLSQKLHLPTHSSGLPILKKKLEWTEGLYVSGAGAELQLGPGAPNIIGARRAGFRILAGIAEDQFKLATGDFGGLQKLHRLLLQQN
jgi:hypothetical protein